jgi:putative heme-binding domain-containing protein
MLFFGKKSRMTARSYVPLIALFVFFGSGAATAFGADTRPTTQPYGIETRVPWTVGHVTGTPEPPPAYQTERAFPKLTFSSPLDLAFAPGSNRVFVVEQGGKIFSFPDEPDAATPDLFADLAVDVQHLDRVPNCAGFFNVFGMAFHPKYADNHFVYMCYLLGSKNGDALPNGTRVSRFTVSKTDPPRIDPASEVVMLEWRGGGHNAGCVKFGLDGCLYVSAGDSADPSPPDPLNTGQDISDLLSSIMRIDVDHQDPGKTYAIPPDNPFVHTPGARGEVWAYGLRNPWRFSIDSQTGNVWVGDVGWELWESVLVAKSGGNYGWSIMEGPNPVHPNGKLGPTPLLRPLVSLPHSEAASITGGAVYHGSRLPDLRGSYIFGDWMTQRLWAAKVTGDKLDQIDPYRVIAETDQKIVSFGVEPNGELLIVDYSGGGLWRIVPNDTPSASGKFPRKLSETGLFSSTPQQTPQTGVIPFSINAPQWVDGAVAEHWVAVPGDARVTWGKGAFAEDIALWPKDSVLARTLFLPVSAGNSAGQPASKKVETQLLHFTGKQWHGYTYAWNDQGTDADLVAADGEVRMISVPDSSAPNGVRRQRWQFGGRSQCIICHNTWCDFRLGFNPQQLDRPAKFGEITDNQVRTFRHIGFLLPPSKDAPPEAADAAPDTTSLDRPALIDPYDTNADLYQRARSYLHANCSHCHRNGAGGSAIFDVRKELTLAQTKIVNGHPNLGDFGIAGGQLLCPGDPARSVMLYRMSKLGRERMPHIASDVVDERGVDLIRQWAVSLADQGVPAPPDADAAAKQAGDLHVLTNPGSSTADLTAAADRLLVSTGGAFALVCELEAGHLPAPAKQMAIAHGLASTQDLVHDLFRRFDPNDAAIDRLGPQIKPDRILSLTGDAERGRKIFFEQGGLCAKCHRVGGQGTDFGPDLSHIATKYKRPDILDNILNPSKTIAQGFANYTVKTKSNDVYTGLLVSKSDKEIVLKDATLKPIHIPATDVERMIEQKISAMPEGLLADLTPQQAADMLEFLVMQK